MERNCDGSDPRIMDAISRASKNSARLASLCLGQGQPQGNVRPHWVSWGGLLCVENHPLQAHGFHYWATLQLTRFLNWWHVMETLGRKWKSEQAGLFWILFSLTRFSTFIHLIYTYLLSNYCVSDAVIRAGGRVKHENISFMGLISWWRRCAPVDQRVRVFTPSPVTGLF